MKLLKISIVGIILCLVLLLAACDTGGNLVLPTRERVTFALVLNTRTYNGEVVIAELKTQLEEPAIETIEGTFQDYPNTTTQAWAQMTTLEKLWTKQRYFLVFYIDMDGRRMGEADAPARSILPAAHGDPR